MNRQTRRKALSGFLSLSVAALSGCAEIRDAVPGVDGGGKDLREEWEDNDDYPEDEFRNHQIGRYDLARFTGVDGTVETNFGFHTERLRLGVSEDYHRSATLEVFFESTDPVDVYIIPEEVSSDVLENPDLTEYEHLPEHSEFETDEYREVFETTAEEELYTMVVTLADFHPPQTIEEEGNFVSEREETVLEGWTEQAVYIPFESYEENDVARRRYNFDSEDVDW